jgi:hypothetical protein
MNENEDFIDLLRRNTNLGHAKRNDSFLRQVALVLSSPGAPVPQGAGGAAKGSPSNDLISMYRFVDNDAVSLEDLRKTRAKAVLERVPEASELIIVHDVTLLDYSSHHSKADRRKIGNHRGKGYEYISCIAVDPAKDAILGVIHDTVVSDTGPDDADMMDYDYDSSFDYFSPAEKKRLRENHRHQMAVHVNGLSETLSNYKVIHVADREFDDIRVLDRCIENGCDFVVRSSANRNVQIPCYEWVPKEALTAKQQGHPVPEGYCCASIKLLLEHAPCLPYKKLPLDSRGRITDDRSADRYAQLSVGSFRARLYRSAMRNRKQHTTPRPVDVNVVIIREDNPPGGSKPILWVLFTSLSIDTPEQVERIGYTYELRWRIEQYFRLLKSGWGIERYRFDNAGKISRLLIILTIASMMIVDLKRELGLPSKGELNDQDYQRIKKAMLEPDNEDIDINLRLFAFIAKYGGWIGRRRDPIGPIVLMRGLLQVLAILDAYERFGPLIKEASENPHILRRLFCV